MPKKGIFVPYGHILCYVENHRRQKSKRKLSAMIFHTTTNRSRVSFVVPNVKSLLGGEFFGDLSPDSETDDECESPRKRGQIKFSGMSAYDDSDDDEKIDSSTLKIHHNKALVILTPTGMPMFFFSPIF